MSSFDYKLADILLCLKTTTCINNIRNIYWVDICIS